MNEFEDWDKEKLKRLGGDREEKPPLRTARVETDHTTVYAEAEMKGKSSTQRAASQPWEHQSFISSIVVVPVSVAIGFVISAVTVWPLVKIISASWFHCSASTSRTIAFIAAFLFMYPISRSLEKISLLRGRKVNTLKIFLVFFGCFLLVLFVTRVVMTPAMDTREPAKKMLPEQVIPEKQLPIAGYLREEKTKRYLKAVQEVSSQLPPTTDFDTAYDNYRRIYVEPLQTMGYEYDPTIMGLVRHFVDKNFHAHFKTKDEFELMAFNAVCFRDRLLADGIITEQTRRVLKNVGSEWKQPVPVKEGEPVPTTGVADYDSLCPVTDLKSLYPNDAK